LAGRVHGVVVQIAIEALPIPSFEDDSGVSGNLTKIAGLSLSWYSTSASASAVCAP